MIHMMLLSSLCSAIVLITAFAISAQAQTVIPVAEDTYSLLQAPDSSMGTEALLRVRAMQPSASSQDLFRKAYLKFDLRGFSGTITKAELKIGLERVATPGFANLYPISNDSWTEATLTWNNAPAVGAVLRGQRFPSRSPTLPDTAYVFDVTSYVQSEFAGNKIVSFCLADDSTDGLDLRIHAKETTTKPLNVCSLVLNRPATGVGTEGGTVPGRFELGQNFPNPFNPTTSIRYDVAATQNVRLEVFDLLGRSVAVLVNNLKLPGSYTVPFGSAQIGSGVYFYTLTSGHFRETKQMIVLK